MYWIALIVLLIANVLISFRESHAGIYLIGCALSGVALGLAYGAGIRRR